MFTGSLTIPRREAADLAARAGCDVAASVTKITTLLIVGDQDISKLNGKSKSSKHLKAEDLIGQGCSIRLIVGDQDISKLNGKSKSSKHLKAEDLIGQGCSIRVLRESDFQSIVVAQAVHG
ncbi:hypothetical protein [Novilysobacter viscosus]|uniref:hypothetical protein n=1 Tax=Novilysobacter viscosus TaxID=3098602 RepID=UPI003F880A03